MPRCHQSTFLGWKPGGQARKRCRNCREAREKSPIAPIPHSAGKKPQPDAKFGEALGASELPRDSGWVGVGREELTTSSRAGSSPLPRIPTAQLCSAGVCAASSSLGSSLSSSAVQEPSLSAWLVRQAPRRAAAPLASWPSSLGNLTWTRPAPAPSFPWKVPHKRLRSLFSAPGEKGLC